MRMVFLRRPPSDVALASLFPRRLRTRSPMKTLPALLGCVCLTTALAMSCSSPAPAGFVADSGAEVAQCAGASTGKLPSGDCEPGADCHMTTASSCADGVSSRPSSDPEWDCTCSDGSWACRVVAGGLSTVSCDVTDAGAPVVDSGPPSCVVSSPDAGSPTAEELPIGAACSVDGAKCAVTTKSTCAGGVKYRPASDPQWECTCNGTWSCKVVGGGLGTVECDGGVDDDGGSGDGSTE
jgi:hypothetical protein